MPEIEAAVQDNASQAKHAQELEKDVQALTVDVSHLERDKTIPDGEVLSARSMIGLLQQEERGLLQQRTDVSKASATRSFVLSLACVGLALLIVVVLFVFLFRDAMLRSAHDDALIAAKDELEATVQLLTARAEESSLLTMARDEMQLCTTAKQAHESTVRHMQLLLPGSCGAMMTINNSRSMVEIVSVWGAPKTLLDGFSPDACCGLRIGKERWRLRGKSELHCMHFAGKPPESYLCVPLAAHGETLGVVYVECLTAESLVIAEARTSLIQQLAELASLSIASLNLRAKLERQSIRDGLTGLFNRHFMEIALERELHRATREKTSLAMLMLDVDHFKLLNDTYGHEAGDVVLREVATTLQKSLRDEDVICRYGGEEFVVIMPDASEEVAVRRAELIRSSVAEIRMHFRGELLGSVTISIGIAMYPEVAKDSSTLLRLADGALYRAKNSGRNKVVLEDALALKA